MLTRTSRSRSHSGRVAAEKLPSTSALPALDSATRLCVLARKARERLREWVAVPLPVGIIPGMMQHELEEVPDLLKKAQSMMSPMSPWFKAYGKVGEHEGCGIILIIARVDPQGTGDISRSELEQLNRNVENRAENVLGFITTIMIVSTLSLAVTVPLIIWPLSTSDGVVDNRPQFSPSLGGGWPGGAEWYAAWLGSPALAVVHWFEIICLSSSIYIAISGTITGMVLYSNMAIYAPDTQSKLFTMYENYASLSGMFYSGFGSIITLYVGLIFLTARVCPLACLTLFAMLVMLFQRMFLSKAMFTAMFLPALNQLRIAREILHAEDAGHALPQVVGSSSGMAVVEAEATPVVEVVAFDRSPV